MIKFNKLKAFQGYHNLFHTNMLSEVGEKGMEWKWMQCVGARIIPALPWGAQHVKACMWGRREHQALLCSSTALWNGADSDPKGKVRLDKVTIAGAMKSSHLWQI